MSQHRTTSMPQLPPTAPSASSGAAPKRSIRSISATRCCRSGVSGSKLQLPCLHVECTGCQACCCCAHAATPKVDAHVPLNLKLYTRQIFSNNFCHLIWIELVTQGSSRAVLPTRFCSAAAKIDRMQQTHVGQVHQTIKQRNGSNGPTTLSYAAFWHERILLCSRDRQMQSVFHMRVRLLFRALLPQHGLSPALIFKSM